MTTTKLAMVDLDDDHKIDKCTEKVSSYVLLLFIQHLLLLILVLLLLDCCAVDLTFKQTVRRGAVVPVNVVVRGLGILWTKRINLKRKGKLFSLLFYPTSFPSAYCSFFSRRLHKRRTTLTMTKSTIVDLNDHNTDKHTAHGKGKFTHSSSFSSIFSF